MKARAIAAFGAVALLLPLLCGCAPTRRARDDYSLFDTVCTVTAYEPSASHFHENCDYIFSRLQYYSHLYDIYYEYEGMTNLKTVNDRAKDAPLAVPQELIDLLSYSQTICDETDGACNIAMGAVLRLWRKCRDDAANGKIVVLPTDAALRAAAEHCKKEDVVLGPGTVFLADPEMSLDVGAVAKGYAASRVAEEMREKGLYGYALSLGGNLVTLGTKADGSPWTAGVENPDRASDEKYLLRVDLSGGSLVTSGTYERYFELDGVCYHHIIDPVTLHPENRYRSVTIFAEDSARADAYSTAVFNMACEDGRAFVEARRGVEACWVMADGTVTMTDGFAEMVIE